MISSSKICDKRKSRLQTEYLYYTDNTPTWLLMCMHFHSRILNFMGSRTAVSDLHHIVVHVLIVWVRKTYEPAFALEACF